MLPNKLHAETSVVTSDGDTITTEAAPDTSLVVPINSVTNTASSTEEE